MNKQNGFAHIALLGALVLVVGVMSLAGYRVYKTSEENSRSEDASIVDEAQEIRIVEINSAGTAANTIGQDQPTNADDPIDLDDPNAEVINVETDQDLSTAYGSLKHVEKELKARRFENVLSFVTPRLFFQAAGKLNVDENSEAIKNGCENSPLCVLGIDSTTFSSNYREEAYDYPYATVSGSKLIFKLEEVNSNAAKRYGNLDVTVYMLDIGESWVIDKITAGSHVF